VLQSSPRRSTRGRIRRLEQHRPPSQPPGQSGQKRCCLRRCAARASSASHRPNRNRVPNSWRAIPSLRPLSVKPAWGRHSLSLTRTEIPAPTTQVSPAELAAAQQMCSRQLFPQQESVVRSSSAIRPRCFQTHRSILAAGGQAARSLGRITRSIGFDGSPEVRSPAQVSLWVKVPVIRGRALLEHHHQGRKCSTASHQAEVARFQARWSWGPPSFQASTRRTGLNPGQHHQGSNRGGPPGAAGEASSDRSD